MDAVRRVSLLATAGLLSIAVMLGWVSARPAMSASTASQLASANAYFDSIIVQARESRPRGPRGDALTAGLGYLERLRLGIGSPFRLVDQAMRDPRLDPVNQQRVSWALLGRLLRGEAYVVDPSVLDGAGPWTPDGRGATGAAHLALIERVVDQASDPRAGELAVRLAYALASAEGRLSQGSVAIAEQVAALVRDRALAERDVRDLLADANERHVDVLTLLADRRATHALRVEQPSLAPLTSALRTEAMNDVPAIVAELDTLNQVTAAAAVGANAPLLGPHFAARLVDLGAEQPPLAAIVIALRGQPAELGRATNEETLAGAYDATSVVDSTHRQEALSLLASAVAVRAFAQEAPWFVGNGGPSTAEVTSEFGLTRIDFSRSVRAEWRPYYLRQLRVALRDMQTVFPAVSFAGLRIAVGTAALPDSALAMHDPRTRTLELTVGGSGGTLAHELAHDIDWQTARRLFVVAGGYSTDRAMNGGHGALASSVLGLAQSRALRSNGENRQGAETDRPTELFARGTDWFTATALALRGRSNGFLSAVQDVALPGYAAGAPTVGEAGVESLLSALDQMTFVPDSTSAAFRGVWGDAASIDPLLVLRRVFAVPVSMRAGMHSASRPYDLLPAPPLALCVEDDSPEGKARERLVLLAVEARARGIAAHRARFHRAGHAGWSNALLGVAPWDPAPAAEYIKDVELAIVHSLRTAPGESGIVAAVPAAFASDHGGCEALRP